MNQTIHYKVLTLWHSYKGKTKEIFKKNHWFPVAGWGKEWIGRAERVCRVVEIPYMILTCWLQQNIQRIRHHDEVGFTLRIERWLNIHKLINLIYYIKEVRKLYQHNKFNILLWWKLSKHYRTVVLKLWVMTPLVGNNFFTGVTYNHWKTQAFKLWFITIVRL